MVQQIILIANINIFLMSILIHRSIQKLTNSRQLNLVKNVINTKRSWFSGVKSRIISLMTTGVTEEIINLVILKKKIDHKFQNSG